MSDPSDLEQLINDYADGGLDAEQAQRLLELLETSDEARGRLAAATVMERLMKALGRGPVPSEQIMKAVASRATRHPEPSPAGRRRVVVRKDHKRLGTSGTRLGAPASTAASGGRNLVPVLIVLILMAGLIGGAVWHKWFQPSPPSPGPSENTQEPGYVQRPTPPGSEPIQESAESNTTQQVDASQAPGAEQPRHAPVPMYRAFPLDPPPPPPGEDLSPPKGDGSGEPGFVVPPAAWLRASAQAGPTESEPPTENGLSMTEGYSEPDPPLLWVKVRMGRRKYWAVTPNDLSSLLDTVGERMDLNYGMIVKPVDEIDADPALNPVLYLSTHYHFIFTPGQRATLRRFMLAGGMIVFNAGLGSKPAYDSARRELRLIFPEIPIERLNADHPVYHSFYDLDRMGSTPGASKEGQEGELPWLEGITISCRAAAVISRWGLAAGWEGKQDHGFNAYAPEDALKLGVNLVCYAVSARAWVKRALYASTFMDVDASKAGKLFVAQVVHGGEWRTRYTGLPILLHTFNQRTEVPVKFGSKAVRLTDPEIFNDPLLYLTGHEEMTLSDVEIRKLRDYLQSGGFLFAEACCGRSSFDRSFRRVMRKVFPEEPLQPIPHDDVLFREPNRIDMLGVTPSLGSKRRSMLIRPHLEGIRLGSSYGVIYSPYGLAGGWEMSQMPYADGYEDPDALKLGQNILMYAITQ